MRRICGLDLLHYMKYLNVYSQSCIFYTYTSTPPRLRSTDKHIIGANMFFSVVGCHQYDASNMWIRFTTLLEVF